MKFSVIIPVFNVEKYLEKTLESIVNQTFYDLEIIVVNDGSIDNSEKIIKKYMKKDKRIKYIYKMNGGLSDARNRGIKEATGEYISFVDGDDYIRKDLFEKMNKRISENNPDLIVFGMNLVTEKGECLGKYEPRVINFKEVLRKAFACNKIFKRELFTENNFYFEKGKFYEDMYLIPKLYLASKKAVLDSECYYYYVQRNNSITSEKNSLKIIDMIYSFGEIEKFIIEKEIVDKNINILKKYKKYFRNHFYISRLSEYSIQYKIKNLKKINLAFKENNFPNSYLRLLIILSFLFPKKIFKKIRSRKV